MGQKSESVPTGSCPEQKIRGLRRRIKDERKAQPKSKELKERKEDRQDVGLSLVQFRSQQVLRAHVLIYISDNRPSHSSFISPFCCHGTAFFVSPECLHSHPNNNNNASIHNTRHGYQYQSPYLAPIYMRNTLNLIPLTIANEIKDTSSLIITNWHYDILGRILFVVHLHPQEPLHE